MLQGCYSAKIKSLRGRLLVEMAMNTYIMSTLTIHYIPPPHRVTKFNGVTSLLMYIPSNFGAETTKIYYIGLRGEFAQVGNHAYIYCDDDVSLQAQRQGIVITSYEARPNPADHKTSDYNPVGGFVS